MPLTQAIVYL